jgi:hypothetical protein
VCGPYSRLIYWWGCSEDVCIKHPHTLEEPERNLRLEISPISGQELQRANNSSAECVRSAGRQSALLIALSDVRPASRATVSVAYCTVWRASGQQGDSQHCLLHCLTCVRSAGRQSALLIALSDSDYSANLFLAAIDCKPPETRRRSVGRPLVDQAGNKYTLYIMLGAVEPTV